MSKSEQVRAFYQKNPDADPKSVSEKFGIAKSAVYTIRKEVNGPTEPEATETLEEIRAENRQLRKMNLVLRKMVTELLSTM